MVFLIVLRKDDAFRVLEVLSTKNLLYMKEPEDTTKRRIEDLIQFIKPSCKNANVDLYVFKQCQILH